MLRLLALALGVCLCLAAAPAALAAGDDPGNDGEPVCAAPFPEGEDCIAGGEDEEEGEREDKGGQDEPKTAERCGSDEGEPAPDAEGDTPDVPGEDGEEGEPESGDDELGEPRAEAESAPPAPGFRDFCDAPVFDHDFLRRAWRVRGTSSGVAGNVLTVAVASIARTPARFRDQAGRLVGLEMAVVVGRRTKLARTRTARGARRRSGRRVTRRRLARARRVEVQGKLLPPARWRRDAGGLRVPTLRASRITIVR